MSNLETELWAIWMRYEPQRRAEADAATTRSAAIVELSALNAKRVNAGLPPVGEHVSQQQAMGAQQWTPYPQKTWRDEMDAALLAAVKSAMQQAETEKRNR